MRQKAQRNIQRIQENINTAVCYITAGARGVCEKGRGVWLEMENVERRTEHYVYERERERQRHGAYT